MTKHVDGRLGYSGFQWHGNGRSRQEEPRLQSWCERRAIWHCHEDTHAGHRNGSRSQNRKRIAGPNHEKSVIVIGIWSSGWARNTGIKRYMKDERCCQAKQRRGNRDNNTTSVVDIMMQMACELPRGDHQTRTRTASIQINNMKCPKFCH